MATLAQSIKQTASLDSGESYTNTVSTKTVTLATTDGVGHHTQQEVGTSYEALSVGDVTTSVKYFVTIRNLGDQADVPSGKLCVNFSTSTAGSDFLILDPGELAAFPVKASVNVFLKGDTVAVSADVVVVEG